MKTFLDQFRLAAAEIVDEYKGEFYIKDLKDIDTEILEELSFILDVALQDRYEEQAEEEERMRQQEYKDNLDLHTYWEEVDNPESI